MVRCEVENGVGDRALAYIVRTGRNPTERAYDRARVRPRGGGGSGVRRSRLRLHRTRVGASGAPPKMVGGENGIDALLPVGGERGHVHEGTSDEGVALASSCARLVR